MVPLIKEKIAPGTTIISDCWRAYDCLSKEGYNHMTINHSLHFVDPENADVHTQNVERQWRNIRENIPIYGRTKNHFVGYLAEHQFKSVNRGGYQLTNFLSEIALVYPGPRSREV